MILTEWEVWHTYSLSLNGPIPDLRKAATDIVESGLAYVSATSSGDCAFQASHGVLTGTLGVDVSPDGRIANVTFPEGQSGFATEGLFQTAMMRFSEKRLFDEDNPILPPYVRAQLGECWAYAEDFATRLYPSIKLFANGVLLIELRMFSPDAPMRASEFIDTIVNKHAMSFRQVEVPIGLATLLPRAMFPLETAPLRNRVRSGRVLRFLEQRMKENARTADSGDFSFSVAAVEPEELQPRSLQELARMIARAVAYSISMPRRGALLIALGLGDPYEVEGPWVGRPHIHLTRFEDQQDGARSNEQRHGDALGWIMARHYEEGEDGRRYLPASLRPFDDYGVYVNEALTLWLQSNRSVRRSVDAPGMQKNLSEAVYEQQATAEMVDHGYMIHWRFAERAARQTESTERILETQGELVGLEGAMRRVGRFGELRTLLQSAWRTLGVEELRNDAMRALGVRQAQAELQRDKRVRRWADALAVVLGIGVLPSVSEGMISPVWKWFALPAPAGATNEDVLFLVVAAGVVLALILSLRWWTLH